MTFLYVENFLPCTSPLLIIYYSFVFYLGQAGGFPEPEIIHFNPKEFDFGKKKAFPFRDQVHVG